MTQAQFTAALIANLKEANVYTEDLPTIYTSGTQLNTLLNTIFGKFGTCLGLSMVSFNNTINGTAINNAINGNIAKINAASGFHVPVYFVNNGGEDPINSLCKRNSIYYNGKTYICYGSVGDHPYIITYTHATGIWSTPIRVGTNPNPYDIHQQPAMFFDNNGYIHVFHGAHNSNIKYEKSNNPEDISAWTHMTDIAGQLSYPNVYQLSDGTVYLFFRLFSPFTWQYRTSTDNCATWSAATTLINFGTYMNVIKNYGDDTFHVFGSDAVSTGYFEQKDVYYCYRNPTDGKWYGKGGTELTLPIAKADTFAVYKQTGTKSICFMPTGQVINNNPKIIFSVQDSTTPLSFDWKFAKWVTSAWVIVDIVSTTNREQINGGNIEIISENVIYLYLQINSRLEKWGTTDGGSTWSLICPIIANGAYSYCPTIVYNGQSIANIVMADYIPVAWQNIAELYLYGANGFIGHN